MNKWLRRRQSKVSSSESLSTKENMISGSVSLPLSSVKELEDTKQNENYRLFSKRRFKRMIHCFRKT